MPFKRVVFGGMGIPVTGGGGKLGQCSFNGQGRAASPVLSTEKTIQKIQEGKSSMGGLPTGGLPTELTKPQIQQAIEKKIVAAGMIYSKELHRKICKLNKLQMQKYLAEEENFIPETTKKANKKAEQTKAQKEAKEDKTQKELIAEILELQIEDPMSEEELSEMSPQTLQEYMDSL